MTIGNQIRDEKLQYDINKEVEKILALSSGKIDTYKYLTGEEILPSNQQQMIEQAKNTYSPLGKAFEKQTKEQVKAIKDFNISDKASELRQIEAIFQQNVLNDLISNKLKIIELQDSIELDKLNYKNYDFNNVSLPSVLLRDIYTNDLLIENADNEQDDLYKRFYNLNKGRKLSEKSSCLKNVKILLKAKEDVLNSFKSNLFTIMSDKTPYLTTRETSINKIINDEKGINNEIFNDYFRYQNPSFLAKDLIKTDQSKN